MTASIWAGGLGAATAALAETIGTAPPHGLVAGAVAAGIVAVAADRRYFAHGEPEDHPDTDGE